VVLVDDAEEHRVEVRERRRIDDFGRERVGERPAQARTPSSPIGWTVGRE